MIFACGGFAPRGLFGSLKFMSHLSSIVVLTGAGISAESGIKTFRDHNGLWENHRIEDVASIDGFRRNPELVQSFYNARRAQLRDENLKPNAAHLALVELEREWKGDFLLVTQNVDHLHERAGSRALLHMHGELAKVRCGQSGRVFDWLNDLDGETKCECCATRGTLRPHIVWFGEMPLDLDRISERLDSCDLFIAIGTSGQVYPAAGFVHQLPRGCRKIEVNPEPSMVSGAFDELRKGPATREVPKLVREILNSGKKDLF